MNVINPNWLVNANTLAATWLNMIWRACWTGSLLVLIVLGVCRILPRLPHTIRCGLWWLVCLKFALSLVWTTPITLPVLPARSAVPAEARSPLPLWAFSTGRVFVPTSSLQQAQSAVLAHSDERPSAVSTPTLALVSPALLCLAAWLLGVMVRLLITGWHIRRLRRLIHAARVLQSAQTERVAPEIAAALELRRVPRLLVTDCAGGPLALGLVRPTVLLCRADLERLTSDELRVILAHEFAHVRRGDLWHGLIPHAAHILFWFYPLIWLAYREFDMAREAACDARALQATQAPPDVYAQLLVKIGGAAHTFSASGALGVQSHFRMLQRRIVMLTHNRGEARIGLLGLLGLFGLLGAAGLVPWRLIAAQPTHRPVYANPRIPTSDFTTPTDWAKILRADPLNLNFWEDARQPILWDKISLDDAAPERSIASYDYGVDSGGYNRPGERGIRAAYIAARKGSGGAVALVQRFRADKYRGKHIRVTAYVRCENLPEDTGLILTLETPRCVRGWNRHGVRGTTDWTRFDYVADVDKDCLGITFGTGIRGGKGKVWISNLHFEVAGRDAALTPDTDHDGDADNTALAAENRDLPRQPVNLDFKQGLRGYETSSTDTDKTPYKWGVENTGPRPGLASGWVVSEKGRSDRAGGLVQTFRADDLRGRRIRFRAFVRTQGERAGATPFVRIDAADRTLAWNTPEGYTPGTTPWHQDQYVFDVPANAQRIAFGMFMSGRGKAWTTDFRFDAVNEQTPVTRPDYDSGNLPRPRTKQIHDDPQPGVSDEWIALFPRQPQNLDFARGLEGWANDNPTHDADKSYAIGIPKNGRLPGKRSATLMSTVEKPQSYGTLMQNFQPGEEYRGKRIRLSAYLRTQEVAKEAGLWIVIYDKKHPEGRNMEKAPIKGTTDWTRYEWVLDVPDTAQMISFGIDLTGRGKVGVDHFKIEAVGSEVPVSP